MSARETARELAQEKAATCRKSIRLDAAELLAQLNHATDEAETHLAKLAQLRCEQHQLVHELRTNLVTWQQIGNALGVTRQAAQQSYRHLSS